jgi:hypothetical protein
LLFKSISGHNGNTTRRQASQQGDQIGRIFAQWAMIYFEAVYLKSCTKVDQNVWTIFVHEKL